MRWQSSTALKGTRLDDHQARSTAQGHGHNLLELILADPALLLAQPLHLRKDVVFSCSLVAFLPSSSTRLRT